MPAAAGSYDLGRVLCGVEYGVIHLKFGTRNLRAADFKKKLSMIPHVKQRYEKFGIDFGDVEKSGFTTLFDEASAAFEARQKDRQEAERFDTTDLSVPIGSEDVVAALLQNHGVIAGATHAVGVCGGSELSYLDLKGSKYKLELGKLKELSSFGSRMLGQWVSHSNPQGVVEEGPGTVAPFPPYLPSKRFNVTVPSDISRGGNFKGSWDNFDVILSVQSVNSARTIVVVHAENLRVAPLVAVRKAPPPQEYFRQIRDSGPDYEGELSVASRISELSDR